MLEPYVPDYPFELNQSSGGSCGSGACNIPDLQLRGNEICSIASGDGKHSVHFMHDKHCEELAFPVLFPRGRYDYQVDRQVKLSPTKYFKQGFSIILADLH